MKLNKFSWKRVWRLVRYAVATFFILSIGSVIFFRFIPVPVTPLMLIRCGEQIAKGKTLKLQKDWVSMRNISPNMVQAVVASEDNRFPDHFGFDFDAIRKAIRHNEHSKRLRGASTISQQTAKNVFLWPRRSYLRKGIEAYFTLLIEVFWTKERIMEVYLNIVEMGDGVYGVQAASQKYFHKPASRLTQSEAAMLAAILPSPIKRNPANPSRFLINSQYQIIVAMRQLGPVQL